MEVIKQAGSGPLVASAQDADAKHATSDLPLVKQLPAMKVFSHLGEVEAVTRWNEHGGNREIQFRRLWSAKDFQAPIDFVDFTRIPPGSSIGWHSHIGNEELYFIAQGAPLVRVQNEQRRLARGDISVVRSGQSHELINDTTDIVEILVFQVRLSNSKSTPAQREENELTFTADE